MLILDFDGVLMNSLDEVALTTYNAVTGNLFTSLTSLPARPIDLFKRNRFHVQQIGDAISLMNWCLENHRTAPANVLSQDAYRNIVAAAAAALTDRTNLIYETRSRLIDRDPERWLALHQPYQPLWHELLEHKPRPVILTNKNRDAVLRLCRHFELNIREEDVFSGDDGMTKAHNMHQIQVRFQTDRLIFVDDSVKNLHELAAQFNAEKQAISPALASWGYTGPGDAERARRYGYQVLRQSDLILLFGKRGRRRENG